MLYTAKAHIIGAAKSMSGLYVRSSRSIGSAVAQFLLKFTNQTTTNPDGTRELVGTGTNAVNAELFTGGGLRPNQSIYLDTGLYPNLSQPSTFMYFTDSYFNGSASGCGVFDDERYFLAQLNQELIYGAGTNFEYSGNHGVAPGEPLHLAMRVDNGTCSAFSNGNFLNSFAYGFLTDGVSNQDIRLMRRKRADPTFNNYAMQSDIGCAVYVPVALTDTEIANYQQAPERLLYRENGTLKSDTNLFPSMTQAVLTDMEDNGIGFCYLMNEFTTDGIDWFTKDLVSMQNKLVTGMNSATYYTNALGLPYGVQSALIDADGELKIIDWQASDNASLVSEALSENNLDVNITGDPATAITVTEA